MKTKTLIVTVAMLLMACHPKNEIKTEPTLDYTTADISYNDAAPACAPPPIRETIKFVPPVIKDDAIEENTTSNEKSNPLTKNKKIIKDGTISIKVKDVEAAKKRMDVIVNSHNGYYENESFDNNSQSLSYNLKVRVPSNQFESFLRASEKGDGEITNKNITARDVTEEYIDGETRLNSKRLFRNRYNQLLAKAAKIDDMLAIEENIRVLQEEIESEEGHLKFINDQVSYSTLEIYLYFEKEISIAPVKTETFFQRFKNSLAIGWTTIVNALLWSIAQWPWLIVIIVFTFILKVLIKRHRKNR